MKKIILFLAVILAIAIFSGYKQSAQNEPAEKKAPEGKPRILFLLSNEKGKAARPASLWWSYKQSSTGQPGC